MMMKRREICHSERSERIRSSYPKGHKVSYALQREDGENYTTKNHKGGDGKINTEMQRDGGRKRDKECVSGAFSRD